VVASTWISTYSEPESKIYADMDKISEIYGYGSISPDRVDESGYFPEEKGYIFIGFYNYINNLYTQSSLYRVHSSTNIPTETVLIQLKNRNFIYNNGAGFYN
jgi:uncharacterized membrane protein